VGNTSQMALSWAMISERAEYMMSHSKILSMNATIRWQWMAFRRHRKLLR